MQIRAFVRKDSTNVHVRARSFKINHLFQRKSARQPVCELYRHRTRIVYERALRNFRMWAQRIPIIVHVRNTTPFDIIYLVTPRLVTVGRRKATQGAVDWAGGDTPRMTRTYRRSRWFVSSQVKRALIGSLLFFSVYAAHDEHTEVSVLYAFNFNCWVFV